jgi:trk system potassium uptake protein TrkH
VNFRRLLRTLGLVLYVLSGAQLVPLLWCIVPADLASAQGLLVGSVTSAVTGFGFRLLGSDEGEFYRRDGVMTVVGSWFLASIVGAIPYLASGAVMDPVDALFESTSGFKNSQTI